MADIQPASSASPGWANPLPDAEPPPLETTPQDASANDDPPGTLQRLLTVPVSIAGNLWNGYADTVHRASDAAGHLKWSIDDAVDKAVQVGARAYRLVTGEDKPAEALAPLEDRIKKPEMLSPVGQAVRDGTLTPTEAVLRSTPIARAPYVLAGMADHAKNVYQVCRDGTWVDCTEKAAPLVLLTGSALWGLNRAWKARQSGAGTSPSPTPTAASGPPPLLTVGARPLPMQTAKVLGGSAAVTGTLAGASAVAHEAGLLGNRVVGDYSAFALRATVGGTRTVMGNRLANQVKKLEAGTNPTKQLDALERTLVTNAGRWGVSPAARKEFAEAIGTLRQEVQAGQTGNFNAAAIATLKMASPATIWASDTVAGKLADTTTALTFAYNNGSSLAGFHENGFDPSNAGSWVSLLALNGNFLNAMRAPVPYLGRMLDMPGFAGSKAFQNFGLVASGAYTVGGVAYTGYGLANAKGPLDVGKALSVGVFSVGTGFPVWRAFKPTLFPGTPPANLHIDPGYLTSGGILGLSGFGLAQAALKPSKASEPYQVPDTRPQASADGGTPARPLDAGVPLDAAATPPTQASDASTPEPAAPDTGPEPDVVASVPTRPRDREAPKSTDTPPVKAANDQQEPSAPVTGPTAKPDTPDTPPKTKPAAKVVVVDPKDRNTTTLWAISRHNIEALLSAKEIETLPRNKETILGIERLVAFNPQYHFDMSLFNGKPGDGPGDPDTINPKRHREIRLGD